MFFEWILVVVVEIEGMKIELPTHTYSNPIECDSAKDWVNELGGIAWCTEITSDKHPM